MVPGLIVQILSGEFSVSFPMEDGDKSVSKNRPFGGFAVVSLPDGGRSAIDLSPSKISSHNQGTTRICPNF